MLMMPVVRAEIIGGDAVGRGQEPALCWWLPDGASVQHAYRLRTDDGFDTGRVDGETQLFVRVPVFDRSRRSAAARVKVWTDLGESEWSDPVALKAGLSDADWSARWIGVAEGQRPAVGFRPAYWLRTAFATPPASQARLYITALGLYEAFLDGQRVGDVELAPGYTQYRARVQHQAYDVTPLVPPGRHVLAVLLADGWYRGQVGLPRAADQYGRDLALRAQPEVRTGPGWQVVAGSWLTMVDRGATTMWEDWDGVDSQGVPRGSLNHYSKGTVATFLHRYVAGLRPAEPGYRAFEVHPRPGGGITWASTRHIGPFGPIDVTWRRDDGSMELDLFVPGGSTATVVMPGAKPHDVGPGRHHWAGAAPAD